MSLTFFLRKYLPELPYSLGKPFALIPYSWRPGIGSSYNRIRNEIDLFENIDNSKKKDFIFERTKKIAIYAFENIQFYKDYYQYNKFNPNDLISFDDLKEIPIINKKLLLEYDLKQRSNQREKKMLVNTGGSSGRTLSLYVQSDVLASQWAHFHYIWKKQMGFNPNELKLLMVGRSHVKNIVSFDFIRNSLRVDIYKPFYDIAKVLLGKYRNIPIYYLHGYPSIIYEFAIYCQGNINLLKRVQMNLKGCILNSEYPIPEMRDLIEKTFGVKSFAFYGHTEGCIIAYENTINIYNPAHSYGYVESVRSNGIEELVGTSYINLASPLIRYNTEDQIHNIELDKNLLKSFSMVDGRASEYILDRNGKRIPLTGLIFGRHHKLFDLCHSIQIKQTEKGSATIYYVPKDRNLSNVDHLFDSSNVEICFNFQMIERPIKTVSGKVKLLVK